MADDLESEKDILGDNWLSSWEAQCLDEWDRNSNMDELVHAENEQSLQKLWLSFQNSASAIAQLYKEGSQHGTVSLWVPFQNSASSVTMLHRDSQEVMKKAFDLGCQHGSQRKTKELLSWARKRRRHIRRDDLIAYLCGKTAPIRNHHHHHWSGNSLARTPTRVSVGMDRSCSPRHNGSLNGENKLEDSEPDLQPFRDALALQGLNGAMSNVSMGRGSPHSVCGTPSGGDVTNPEVDDFHYFILNEMTQHCESRKRNSSSDARIDSPSRKRSRFCFNNDGMDV